ncbi:MAG: hypothetical protein V4671_12060 [Armatimonadota bacterium]
MQQSHNNEYKFWDFIENGDFGWTDATPEEELYFREVAAAFLRATFEPPTGYFIDVLEAGYSGSRFPVIALGWNHDPEPLSPNDRQEFIRRMVEPLNRFVRSVDWEEVGRIRADAASAPGMDNLKRLLAELAPSVPLAQRCVDALSDARTVVHLAPRPLDAVHLRDTEAKRAPWQDAVDRETGRSVENSEPKLPALSRMADAGKRICIHSLETNDGHFFVITDAAINHLVVIELIRDR